MDDITSMKPKPGNARTSTPEGEQLIGGVRQSILSHASVLDAVVEMEEGKLNVLVTLKKGHAPSDELKSEIAWYVTGDLGNAPPFREIAFSKKTPAREEPLPVPAPVAGETVHVSGHAIDTADVARILEESAEVRRAIVSGVRDVRKGQLLLAEVTLGEGCEPSEELRSELAWSVHVNLGPMALFRDIRFVGLDQPAGRTAPREAMVVVDGVAPGSGGIEITSHRISTTEVTKALLDHPDVMDAAALTVPDNQHGEILKAFVKLNEGVVPSNDLKLDLAWHVMAHLKPIAVFKNIELESSGPLAEPAPGIPAEVVDEAGSVRISGQTVLSADVEKALVSHADVTEAAVIGIPDEKHGEALQAFVVLRPGATPNDELKEELAWFARTEVGPEVVFKFVEFRKFLPKTDSPANLRSVLKADVMDVPTRMFINVVD
jgi:acyl-coenzyme A synthetase/AMP-(fatty) acid ligase